MAPLSFCFSNQPTSCHLLKMGDILVIFVTVTKYLARINVEREGSGNNLSWEGCSRGLCSQGREKRTLGPSALPLPLPSQSSWPMGATICVYVGLPSSARHPWSVSSTHPEMCLLGDSKSSEVVVNMNIIMGNVPSFRPFLPPPLSPIPSYQYTNPVVFLPEE